MLLVCSPEGHEPRASEEGPVLAMHLAGVAVDLLAVMLGVVMALPCASFCLAERQLERQLERQRHSLRWED